jgi:hypothetical protein
VVSSHALLVRRWNMLAAAAHALHGRESQIAGRALDIRRMSLTQP